MLIKMEEALAPVFHLLTAVYIVSTGIKGNQFHQSEGNQFFLRASSAGTR